ncbi:MAG: hypothetical protein RQ952_04925 [Thermoproteota archaeon]|nr:hypothetical protein [Thermoproteota archaeon]
MSEFKIKYNKFMPVMMLERENFDSMDYCLKLLKEKGVLLTPMSYFLKRNAIRMYLGYEDSRKIEEAIRRMVEFNNLYFKTK